MQTVSPMRVRHNFPFTAVSFIVCTKLWPLVKTAWQHCTKNGIGSGQTPLWDLTRHPDGCGSANHKDPTELHWVQFWCCRSYLDSFILCPAWTHNKCWSIEVRFCSGVVLPQDTKCAIDGKKPKNLSACVSVWAYHLWPGVEVSEFKENGGQIGDRQTSYCLLFLLPLAAWENCQ